MIRQGRTPFVPIAAAAMFAVVFANCGKLERAQEVSQNPNVPQTTGQYVDVQGSVQGSVASGVLQTQAAYIRQAHERIATTNACADANFVAYAVGGNMTILGSGKVDSSGNFTLDWTESVSSNTTGPSEAVLVFDCSTPLTGKLTCYGHPGDTGLNCDVISNAVIVALENALGAKVESSTLYAGLSLAKIVQGLVETLKLVSQLNPNSDFVTQMQNATTLAQIEAIIASSPVGALFNSIQSLAKQQAAKKQASQPPTTALQQVWTAKTVIELLVGLGLPVTFNVDPNQYSSNGGYQSSIGFYQFGFMDILSGTDFMAQSAVYVSNLYDQLYAQQQTAPVTLLCQAQGNYGNNQQLYYAPDPNGPVLDPNGNPVGNANQITCLGPTAIALGVAASPGIPNAFNIQTVIGSPFTEADRNDPTGTQSNNNGRGINNAISMVDVFPELQAYIVPGGQCQGYYIPGPDGSPSASSDMVGLAKCLRTYNADKYVAGAVGIYRFLTDTSLQSIHVSLDDIYKSLVDGMAVRLATNSSGQYSSCVQVTITDSSNNRSDCISNILFDAQLVDPSDANNQVFYSVCPYPICINGQEQNNLYINNNWTVGLTTAQFEALMTAARPGFSVMMRDLVNIPTLDTLQTQIFTAAHHVDYNIAGSQYYNVLGKDNNGDYIADEPILCVIRDSQNNRQSQFIPGQSHIFCEIGAGTWNLGAEDPNLGGFKDYTGWFSLQNRGSSEQGFSYYALTDLYTNAELTLQGQTFRVIDFSANTALAQSMNVTLVTGSTAQPLYTFNAPICNAYINSSGQYQESCYQQMFAYVGMVFPNSNTDGTVTSAASFFPSSYYQPFSTSIPITIVQPNNGYSYQTNIQVALDANNPNGVIDPNSGPYSLCLSQPAFSISSTDPSQILSAAISSSYLSPCSVLAAQTGTPAFTTGPQGSGAAPYYYPVLTWNGAVNPNNFNYQVIRSDGLQMYDTKGAPYLVPFPTLQAASNGSLGPASASYFMISYNLANPTYNPKYDPYCVDLDADGFCDCTRVIGNTNVILNATTMPTAASCDLGDAVGNEPTISSLPVNGGNPAQYLAFSLQCGGLSGLQLQSCAEANPAVVNNYNLDWRNAVFCAGTQVHPAYINQQDIINRPNQAGNCNGVMGPVTLLRLAARNNAYDIARPQTAMKLISAATQNTGTGVTLRPDQNVFAFSDAVSAVFYRASVPLRDVSVFTPRAGNPTGSPSTYVRLNEAVQFMTVNLLNNNGNSNPGTAILRAFLAKDNLIAPD